MSRAQPLTLAELRELAQADPALSGFSPLSSQNVLLVDPTADGVSATEQARIAAWLRQLPCPSIGIADDTSTSSLIAQASDVLVESATAAAPLLDSGERLHVHRSNRTPGYIEQFRRGERLVVHWPPSASLPV